MINFQQIADDIHDRGDLVIVLQEVYDKGYVLGFEDGCERGWYLSLDAEMADKEGGNG